MKEGKPMIIFKQLKERFFNPVQPLPAGIYHYQAPPGAAFPHRLHLRLEPGGQGILIVNASTVLHLNPTAAEYTYYLVHQTSENEVARLMAKRYRVNSQQARNDYHDLVDRLNILIETNDLDPETFLGFDRAAPYTSGLIAPLRMDCALTYQVSGSASQAVAPINRVKRELQTEEWKTILQKAWQAGIPHAIFTGGEPTLRPDLPDLISYGEELGMVTGLLTDGIRLTEPKYLSDLLQKGLDHIMLLLDPDEEQAWEALRDTIAEDIHVTVHLTLTQKNIAETSSLMDRLTNAGVTSISLSVDKASLSNNLRDASQAAADRGLKLIWDLPVPYSRFHPVALEAESEAENIDGAGKAWIYIEPDGDVLPAQGQPQVLGNLLNDAWENIWKPA
jgi:organic radical activating enzyme